MKNLRKTRRLLLLVLACLTVCPVSAMGPCRPANIYVAAVDKVIDHTVGHPAELALTVFPSFEAEYGVRLIGSDLYVVQLNPSLWASSVVADRSGSYHHDFRNAHAAASLHKATLSPEVATRIRQKFALVISKAKASGTIGIDGTIYRFVLRANGCAETWSPAPGSADEQLVDLTELLVKHAGLASPHFKRRSEEQIQRVLSGIQ
jgi:hypothetical protein